MLEIWPVGIETDGSLSATTASVRENLDRVESAANAVLAEAGADYRAHAELTEMYFTTRTYNQGERTFFIACWTLSVTEGHTGRRPRS